MTVNYIIPIPNPVTRTKTIFYYICNNPELWDEVEWSDFWLRMMSGGIIFNVPLSKWLGLAQKTFGGNGKRSPSPKESTNCVNELIKKIDVKAYDSTSTIYRNEIKSYLYKLTDIFEDMWHTNQHKVTGPQWLLISNNIEYWFDLIKDIELYFPLLIDELNDVGDHKIFTAGIATKQVLYIYNDWAKHVKRKFHLVNGKNTYDPGNLTTLPGAKAGEKTVIELHMRNTSSSS